MLVVNNNDNSFFSNIFKRDSIGSETRRILIKYIITSVIFLIAGSILLTIFLNTGSSEYNIQKYFFIYGLPILLTFGLVLSLNKSTTATKLFLKLIGVVSLIIFGIYVYATSMNSVNIDAFSNYALVTIITLFGLAIVYNWLLDYMSKLQGWWGFFAQLIFYIPCVLYDVWEYILEQVNLTPYSIYLFIALEFILIFIYAFLPDITEKVAGQKESILLQDNIHLLDTVKVLTNSDNLKINPEEKHNENGNYRTNYCISFWVYINVHPHTHQGYNSEKEILTYGFKDNEGIEHVKPMVRYYGGGGGDDQLIERNKLIFYYSRYPPIKQYATDEHTFYDVTIEPQKWNQIVMNYNRNKVEIFINGNLERTFNMSKNLPIYNDLDQISIGDDEGIDGGICNVRYYQHPLSPEQIALTYNTMILSKLPIPRKKDD
tara:strand:+ start:3859 stop:5151 length:1293 start_codon:yes stop_codon:yes gene_type:complete